MKKFETPALEVVMFSVEDIVNESGLLGGGFIGENCVS